MRKINITGVLLDIDGTLMIGPNPIPGADKALIFLRENEIRYRFVSNSTRRSKFNILKKLEKLNVSVSPDEIWTPASAAISYLKNKHVSVCNLLITDDLKQDFNKAGIFHDPKSSYVIVGDAAERFTYDTMNSAFRSLITGGELIALEKDKYWRDTDGLSLSAGPFVSALEFATGCKSVLMGKPSPIFFRAAQEGFSSEGKIIMIGDDIITDVKGAQDAGMLGVITCTGKFKPDETVTCKVLPDAILSSISDLPNLLNENSF